MPDDGDEQELYLDSDSILIMGTDGLFDNMFDHEITVEVNETFHVKPSNNFKPAISSHDTTAVKMQHLAERLAKKSRSLSKNRKRLHTPFSAAARANGFNFLGGKVDDVTTIAACLHSPNQSPFTVEARL